MGTLLDLASLVMIPSGYKDDKLYSVKPTDGSGDFTFSRDGSGASPATRVNSAGLIEKGRTNELTYSNDFSNAAWTKVLTSFTSGQAGYDGSNDAWLLSANGSGTKYALQSTSNTGIATHSLYAKAGTSNGIRISIYDGTDRWAAFDLSSGSVHATGASPLLPTITSVGGGWYRISITSNRASTGWVAIYPLDASFNANYTAAGENVYIQDDQLEKGLIATDYIPTTTTAVSAGLLGDMPRLDYSGGASCPSLLLEPSRTNDVTQSEYFNAWTALNDVTITANSTTSPEGVLNGSLMEASGTGAAVRSVRLGSMPTSTDIKTMSVFAKANATNYIQLYHSGDAQGYVNFDLSSGAVGTSGTNGTGDIEPMGNDWYRCIATFDSGANFGSSIYVGFATSSSASYGGGSVADTSSVYIYGAQYENAASYVSSYIPTYGTATGRAVDLSSVTGVSDLIGQTEGTLFVDVDFNGVNHAVSQTPIFVRTAGANTGYAFINFYLGKLNVGFRVAGSTLFDVLLGSTLSAGRYKIAFAYKSGDLVTYMNGSLIDSRTSTFGTTSYADVHLGGVSGNQLGDGHKQALLFKTRLTNAELAALTTI